ncbi:hypothetical protein Tco_0777183 [Tanacetum coccineum]
MHKQYHTLSRICSLRRTKKTILSTFSRAALEAFGTVRNLCISIVVEKDAFVLSNFQNSGLGPPLGDLYARFLEEECASDTTLLVLREESEDDITHDMTAGEERRAYTNDIVQILYQSPDSITAYSYLFRQFQLGYAIRANRVN